MTVAQIAETTKRRLEWPTVLLAATIYSGWLLLTLYAGWLPRWLLVCLGGWLLAWHNSLQHETIHGHPTGWRPIDAALGAIPLSLWLPYAVYARLHRAHHASANITDPFDDPESRYLSPGAGMRHDALMALERLQSTLLGRLTLGPLVTIGRFLAGELARLRHRPFETARDWSPHILLTIVVLAWLNFCGVGIATYALCFVYPGCALSLLRSFAEHRAHRDPSRRVAIVESRGPLAVLFLNNNLHAAHHERPDLAWFRLPDFHRVHRARLLQANGGLLYGGYRAVFRRFAFRAHDTVLHPAYAGQAESI